MLRPKTISAAISTLSIVLFVVSFLTASHAATKEQILYRLRSNTLHPTAGLIFDPAGNMYGTTPHGGTSADCTRFGNCGTVFEAIPDAHGRWSLKVLHTFASYKFPDKNGVRPEGELTMDTAGNLYGVTVFGGDVRLCFGSGCGTVFELTPGASGKWTYSVLHRFNGNDGAYPQTRLILDKAGNLYGTTPGGGTQSGTVFKLKPGSNGRWTETILYSFPSAVVPTSGLTLDPAGNLYGETGRSVYEVTPGGAFTTLFSFTGNGHGAALGGGLTFDDAGKLYGTTEAGGKGNCGFNGCGVVFQLTRGSNGQWTEKILHYFVDDGQDGTTPFAGVVLDATGHVYGTTLSGGADRNGTVFELTPSTNGRWTERILHAFLTDGHDGFNPIAGLTFDKSGKNLYGAAANGGRGVNGYGAIFKIIP
jgi:uncharacterized repeat protein (TIGR03803 family)